MNKEKIMKKTEKELIKIFSESFVLATKDLSSVINQDIDIIFDNVSLVSTPNELGEILDNIFLLKNTFQLGETYTLFPVSLASPLGDLIMKGEFENSTNMSELKQSAVKELFSQANERYSAEISKRLYQNYTFKTDSSLYISSVQEAKIIIDALSQGAIIINYKLDLGKVSKNIIKQIIPIQLFKQMEQFVIPELEEDSNQHINIEMPSSGEPAIMVQPVQFPSFDDQTSMQLEENKNFDLLLDIKLKLTVELGRAELPIKRVLELTRGSIVELDKIAGEPVELFANGKLIARGEVVVIEDNFGLRITNIISPDDRIKNL